MGRSCRAGLSSGLRPPSSRGRRLLKVYSPPPGGRWCRRHQRGGISAAFRPVVWFLLRQKDLNTLVCLTDNFACSCMYLENHKTSLRPKNAPPSAFGISPGGGTVNQPTSTASRSPSFQRKEVTLAYKKEDCFRSPLSFLLFLLFLLFLFLISRFSLSCGVPGGGGTWRRRRS